MVSSQMIDRVVAKLGRTLYEVPVGFKWFVDGMLDGSLGFGGEESAGASFLRRDGTAWTTDKDGIVPALLAAEITARAGRDPGEIYRELTREFGEPVYDRVDAPGHARAESPALRGSRRSRFARPISPASESRASLTRAPGNDAPIGGLKVIGRKRLVRRAPVRAPRTSTRSTRRASRAPTTCTASCKKRKPSSTQR